MMDKDKKSRAKMRRTKMAKGKKEERLKVYSWEDFLKCGLEI